MLASGETYPKSVFIKLRVSIVRIERLVLTRDFFDAGLVEVAAMRIAASLLAQRAVRRPFAPPLPPRAEAAQWLAVMIGCAAIAWAVSGEVLGTLAASFAAIIATIDLRLHLPRLTMAGVIEMALLPLAIVVAVPWTYMLVRGLDSAPVYQALVAGGGIVSVLLLGVAFATQLARSAMLTHGRWDRPIAPLPAQAGGHRPKVSIHLPCYAEPPELVIATIDRLVALDYPDFEILVCDNNTRDERLWRPVEAHCARLNRRLGQERLRFFHVAPLPGAKAGALNFLLPHTAADAELVAVVDADYLAEPDFLSRLAGFFADPAVGYLQTPHDYRAWDDGAYLRMCYWEYMPSNKVELPGVAEYGAAYTIGTMCLIRTRALKAAGGWAEWCLTEDSEVSVRLRAIGYEGVYVRETFGRGLIPETFEDYKKQRFRWTAGPVQQLRAHWRRYLPRELATHSRMGDWSRLLELQRGLSPLAGAVGIIAGLGMAAMLTWLTAQGALPPVALPPEAWWVIVLGLLGNFIRRWQRYRLAGCTSLAEMAGGEIARMSLAWVQMIAAFAGLSRRPLAWRRTPKFAATSDGLVALNAALPETAFGTLLAVLSGFPFGLGIATGSDVLLLAAFGVLGVALRFLAAPLMAWLAMRRLAEARPAAALSAGAGVAALSAPPLALTAAEAGLPRAGGTSLS